MNLLPGEQEVLCVNNLETGLKGRSDRGELKTINGGECGRPINFINSQVSIVFYISYENRQAFSFRKT